MKYAVFIFTFLIGLASYGQFVDDSSEEPKKERASWKDRLIFNGNVLLSFGNVTVIGANPQVGYKIAPKTVVGIGGQYEYYRFRGPNYEYNTNIYGGSVFARQTVLEQGFIMAEYSKVNWQPFVNVGGTEWIDLFYVGGGYVQRVSDNFSVGITVLYDVIGDPNSPYANPVFRGGGFYNF